MRRLIMAAFLLLPAAGAWAAKPFVVHLADIADQKAVIGTVEPLHETVARARIGGTIASLTVKEGQQVAAGACRRRRSEAGLAEAGARFPHRIAAVAAGQGEDRL